MSVEHKKFLGASIAIVIACGNFGGELGKERLTKAKLCGIYRGFFMSLNFCKNFKGFCGNQILSEL